VNSDYRKEIVATIFRKRPPGERGVACANAKGRPPRRRRPGNFGRERGRREERRRSRKSGPDCGPRNSAIRILSRKPEHCASDILALVLRAVGKDKSRGIHENQSSYGICLNPAVASFREFPASRAEKFLGRHMERIVGREGSHVDNDRREAGRKLRLPRRVHAGSKEQSDAEKCNLPRQWDHRYAHKNQQDDCICDVAQFAGRHDRQTDEAVELPPLVLSGPSCLRASFDAPRTCEAPSVREA
jgi:hypothetical protein